MRKIITIVIFFGSILFAQNTAPEVKNVRFSQRTDGSYKVDIFYDLNDVDGDEMKISMQVSDDAGVSFNFKAEQISGDIGGGIFSGTDKHIVWDFGVEHPQTYNNQIQIKIIANDNPLGGETGTLTDIDGNVYKTIKIGNQWWMAENLKVTRYRNGEPLPNITDNTEWGITTTGAYCSYDNDNTNIIIYGFLYNWYVIDDNRNIAPAGWHVPSDEEWKQLEMNLGMSRTAADSTGIRGTDEGSKLKATSGWNANGGGTNISGFSALPGGYRGYFDGSFGGKGDNGVWWSSTDAGDASWHRSLYYNKSSIGRGGNLDYKRNDGFSIRCVKD